MEVAGTVSRARHHGAGGGVAPWSIQVAGDECQPPPPYGDAPLLLEHHRNVMSDEQDLPPACLARRP